MAVVNHLVAMAVDEQLQRTAVRVDVTSDHTSSVHRARATATRTSQPPRAANTHQA
jgi:hypothetical protein